MMEPKPEVIAARILKAIKVSGYGTSRPDRHTPVFSVEDVALLARAVLTAHIGSAGDQPDDAPSR